MTSCNLTRLAPFGAIRSRSASVASALSRCAAIMVVWVAGSVDAQVPQMPSGNATPIQGGFSSGAPADIPQTNLTPIGPPSGFSAGPPSGFPTGPTAPPNGFAAPTMGAPTLGTPSPTGQGGFTTAPPANIPISPGSPGLFGRIFSSPAAGPTTPGVTTPVSPGFQPSPGFQAAPGFQGGPTTVISPGTTFNAAPPGTTISPGLPAALPPNVNNNIIPNNTMIPNSTLGQPVLGAGDPSLGTVYGTQTAPPTFPNSIYPSSTPSTLFPNGVFSSGGGFVPTATPYVQTAFRLFQGPRFQHTFINAGDKLSDVEVNDTDMSLVFAFPRFLNSSQPLYVIPSFSLHLWNGPDGSIGADLPANAYSAFLDMGWESDPTQILATEFGIRVGVFTDFDTYNSRSIRTLGKGLVHFRLSPFSTLRGGVYYVDRFSVKLVPAFGILCQPNPFTRIDYFFPKPKYAKYCQTVGTKDVWFFAAGDYGGGSWTIRRTSGEEESMDMNELRLLAGFEWGVNNELQAGRRQGFFQIGYAFNREVKYHLNPQDDFDTSDAFLIAAGFGY